MTPICRPNPVSALGRSCNCCIGTLQIHCCLVDSINLQGGNFWHLDCEYKCDFKLLEGNWDVLGELVNIPTDTLIDMLYIILAEEVAISASDAAEIEQIQRELQRRGDQQCWQLQTVN